MSDSFTPHAPLHAAHLSAAHSGTARLGAALHMLDRPATSAVSLAHKPIGHTFVVAMIGVGFCILAAGIADVVSPGSAKALFGLRCLLEALAVVIPTTMIFGTYLRMKLSPRAFLATCALGVLSCGVVGLSLVPIFGFSVLAADGALPSYALPSIIVPAALVLAAVLVSVRVFRTIDDTAAGRFVSASFAVLFIAAFAVRFQPALDAL